MNLNIINDSYVLQPLYSIVASKHDLYACGNGFEPYDGHY